MIDLKTYLKLSREDYSNPLRKEYNKNLIEQYPFLLPKNRWTGKVVEDYDYSWTEMDDMPVGWRIAFGDQMLEELREELVKYNYLDKYFITQIKEKYGTLRWYDNGIPAGKLSEDYESLDVKFGNKYPPFDKENEVLEEIGRDNYYEVKDWKEYNSSEYKEKNKDCIIHLRKRKIIEKCKVWDIINKYEKLSEDTCIDCGAQNVQLYETKGWINFVCEDCAKKRAKSEDVSFKQYCYPIKSTEEE